VPFPLTRVTVRSSGLQYDKGETMRREVENDDEKEDVSWGKGTRVLDSKGHGKPSSKQITFACKAAQESSQSGSGTDIASLAF